MRILKIVLFFIALFNLSCKRYSDEKLTDIKKTKFELKFPKRKYFAIQQGQKLHLVYKIENVGDEMLFISNVQTSCGCLTSTFPKTPIATGSMGIIKLVFDSSKSVGFVEHYFTIVSNSEKLYKEYKFEVNVVPSSMHSKDYEEVYFEKVKEGVIKEAVDGDNTEKGYEVK
jgi:hypothetical protein